MKSRLSLEEIKQLYGAVPDKYTLDEIAIGVEGITVSLFIPGNDVETMLHVLHEDMIDALIEAVKSLP